MALGDVDGRGERRRIAVITGANGVLGLKIAQRMLEGVAPFSPGKTDEQDERIRIILACRSRARAEAAVKKLRSWFPDRTLLLDIEDLDLCSMRNVENFCGRLLKRYPPSFERGAEKRGRTIDWLIFNAGVSEVYAFDWVVVMRQFLFDTMMSFTLPQYMVERVGSVTDDGIPLVFQANTFGHYFIVPSAIVQSSWQSKRLEPLLVATSRVQWSASLETSIPGVYDPLDPTGLHTHHPYASSKRFIELLHCHITSRPHKPLSFLTHPGITDSTVVTPYTFPLRETLQYLKVMAFYTARWCGSPWHGINGYTGALSQVWCALQAGREDEMIKWGCGSDRWGRERLIGTQLWGEADIFAEEAKGAFEVAEGMYREWVFKLGVSEGKSNGEAL